MKKILSFLLCLIIIFSSNTISFASTNVDTVQNTLPADTVIKDGEKYYISTVEDLRTLAKIVNEDGNNCEGAGFWLNSDIVVNDGEFSLSESGEPLYNGTPVEECSDLIVLDPIGSNRKIFKGSFIGDGHTISGLYLNSLFGQYFQPHITNLSIKNSYVTTKGILADTFSSSGYISSCSVEGIVNSDADKVGLYAGSMLGTTIRDCYAEGYVKGNSIVGGFAGYMSVCEVSETMSNTQVTANSTAGGFAGRIYGDDTIFEYCAATGTVYCADETAGQFASSVDLYYFDDGYDILRTLNISYAAVETNNSAKFCYEFEGDTKGVNQCYYMSDEDGENGFGAYTEEGMKTNDFVDVLHADIFAQLEEYPMEWGYFGIYFVGKNGEFPVPFGLHYKGIGVPSCDYGEWEMYSASTERRYCTYHACDGIERRTHYHTWGNYVYNNDAADDVDGTKTAHCTKEGCEATDTVLDTEHLRPNAIPLSDDFTLEKGKLYTISTADELATFAKVCEQDTANVSFVLLNDITINEGTFTLDENGTPTYNGGQLPEIFASAVSFSGTFDGMGHTLSGLRLSSTLFGNCNGATLKNLKIVNSLISDSSSEYTAVICSAAEDTVFENCFVSSYVLGGSYTGGMVGSAVNCTVEACRNEGTVIGTNAGGLAGYIKDCTVSHCYNQGTVAGDKQAGGLAVCLYDSFISYCYNSGDVSANTQNGSAGGFACYINGLSTETYGYTLKNSYTAGEVTGRYTGKLCSSYYGDFLTMLRVYFEGKDVTEADYGELINSRYEAYREDWFLAQGDDYHTADTAPESLSLIAVNNLKADWCPQYIGGKDFVGDADGSNRGYPQLAMFHEHVWSDCIYDKSGKDIASCLCFNCDSTDKREHIHSFGEYALSNDGTTETARCICGESSTQSHVHIWGEYTYNNDADCENSGTKTATCTAKGCTVTDTVNDTEHPATNHDFGEYVADENSLSETAACQNNGCNETHTRKYTVTVSDKYNVSASYSPDCFNEKISLEVAEISANREPGGVYMVEGKSYKQIGLFNIKTIGENGNIIQPNEGFNVTIKMPLPDGYKDRTEVVIYHRFTDGGREKLSTADGTIKVESGFIIFEVSKFSEFEILLPAASAKIIKLPIKTKYCYRSTDVDLNGIEILITYPDGTTKTIDDTYYITVEGFNSNTLGEQTLTVKYEKCRAELEIEIVLSWWQWIIRIILFGFLWY